MYKHKSRYAIPSIIIKWDKWGTKGEKNWKLEFFNIFLQSRFQCTNFNEKPIFKNFDFFHFKLPFCELLFSPKMFFLSPWFWTGINDKFFMQIASQFTYLFNTKFCLKCFKSKFMDVRMVAYLNFALLAGNNKNIKLISLNISIRWRTSESTWCWKFWFSQFGGVLFLCLKMKIIAKTQQISQWASKLPKKSVLYSLSTYFSYGLVATYFLYFLKGANLLLGRIRLLPVGINGHPHIYVNATTWLFLKLYFPIFGWELMYFHFFFRANAVFVSALFLIHQTNMIMATVKNKCEWRIA